MGEQQQIKSSIIPTIDKSWFPPYIYTYPPHRAYRPFTRQFNLDQAEISSQVNVYIHIPFCAGSKCKFCNLLSVADDELLKKNYLEALAEEFILYQDVLKDHILHTINFGGGTPSLLTPSQLEKICKGIYTLFFDDTSTCVEMSMEAHPRDVTPSNVQVWKTLGFSRISIGIQSLIDAEIEGAGRSNTKDTSLQAIQRLRDGGIRNISCDVIYGLYGQTNESWKKTIHSMMEILPETIQLFPLVVRPFTGYGRQQLNEGKFISPEEKYIRYSVAHDILLDKGYTQETQLRFRLPQGGFKHQDSTLQGISLVSFGVSARSYLENVHYRNGYDARSRLKVVKDYMEKVSRGVLPVTDGIFLSEEEKIRKYIIQNLCFGINLKTLEEKFSPSIAHAFTRLFIELKQQECITIQDDVITLTSKGFQFKDAISRTFFSQEVSELEQKILDELSIRKS